jgi:hypothetical protein
LYRIGNAYSKIKAILDQPWSLRVL